MTHPDDAKDLAIHAAIDDLLIKIMRANGFSRVEALERFEAFCENEREEMREAAAYRKAFAHEVDA